MHRLLSRVRSLWHGVRRGAALHEDMDEEFRLHMELRTEDLVRSGVPRPEAERRARVEFGSTERYKDEGRESRGLRPIDAIWFSWLDVKLGARMLAKYPGVTIVGGLALTIGIGAGAAYLEVTRDYLRPALPFEQGERIVGLQNWDPWENDPEPRSMHDFLTWREEMRAVEDLSAFRAIERNIGTADTAAPAHGAEISPSAFQVVRVPAFLGRPLIPADAEEGAPPVIVLGYGVWQKRFEGDPGLIGRTVRVGRSSATVVGVMPEGFAFPVSHEFWVPLRTNAAAYGPRQGPAIHIFGRLAPGVSATQAQAELSALGERATADFPSTHGHLRPRVLRYTELFVGSEGARDAFLAQFIFVVLLLLLSSNVATMVFARTATREHEIAMRFALGSSRGRILGQFFAEALVLSLAAAAVALTIVGLGTERITRLLWEITEGRVPFWIDAGPNLNVTTVLYAVAIAVVGSMVAGVLPALKATRSRLQVRLRHSALGESGLRFGGLWSAMIVIQVAFAVIVLPPAIVAITSLAEPDHAEPGFAAGEYLSARLEMDREQLTGGAMGNEDVYPEFQAAYEELRRRLLAEPAVTDVTFASRLPGMDHPQPGVEVEATGETPGSPQEDVMSAAVGVDYFDTLGVRMVAGRAFNAGDLRPDVRAVVVNEDFVKEILQGRNAVGRRVRYTTRYGEQASTGQPRGLPRERMLEPGPWYEIVGVVAHVGMDTTKDAFWKGRGPGIYHPLTREAMGAGGSYSLRMALHVRGDVGSFVPQLRSVAHSVHPALRVYDMVPLDGPTDIDSRSERLVGRFAASLAALVGLIALLISVAGIYSVLSFTVSRQTREIGIRIALGADRRRIVTGVFSRAMIQIATGLVVGTVIWFYVIVRLLGGGDRVGLLAATAIALTGVGFVACGLPVRRALRVEPTEALRNVG